MIILSQEHNFPDEWSFMSCLALLLKVIGMDASINDWEKVGKYWLISRMIVLSILLLRSTEPNAYKSLIYSYDMIFPDF